MESDKLPNAVQQIDSVYKLDYKYVITDTVCHSSQVINKKENSNFKDCVDYCNEHQCHRFSFALPTGLCSLYNHEESCILPSDLEHALEFHYIKTSQVKVA